jgi:hypothetical protein
MQWSKTKQSRHKFLSKDGLEIAGSSNLLKEYHWPYHVPNLKTVDDVSLHREKCETM